MQKSSLLLAVFLLAYCGIIQAHVVDIHVPTASELAEEQRREEQREIDRAWDIYNDEDASDDERFEALIKLAQKEEIV